MLTSYDQTRLGIDPEKLGLRRSERRLATIVGKGNAFKLPQCLISLPVRGPGDGRLDLEIPDLLLLERDHEAIGRGKGIGHPINALQPMRSHIPSIIGRDLLELHGLLLVVDFKARSAYLEAR